MSADNAYHARYQRERYARRMNYARDALGATCNECGTTTQLHLHHIDPETKYRNISTMASKYSEERFNTELDKCILLCSRCHSSLTAKVNKTGGRNKWAEIKHGTLWAYGGYKCRCPECRETKSKYRKRFA